MLYAWLSALVTGWFAVLVVRQYRARRRPYQMVWSISLWMAAAASAAYALSIQLGGQPALFRLYYILGALWMAAYLGVGSVYLGFGPRAGRWSLLLVTAGGLAGTVLLATAPLDAAALASLQQGSGRGLIELAGPGRGVLVAMNAFGTAAVVGVALVSAVRVLRSRGAAVWAAGNLLIAAGVLIIAAAGSAAGLGQEGDLFWPVKTAGWVVTFGGFTVINRGRAPVVAGRPGDPGGGGVSSGG